MSNDGVLLSDVKGKKKEGKKKKKRKERIHTKTIELPKTELVEF